MKSIFAQNLKKVRELSGLTADEFAEKLGTYRSTVWRYENDTRKPDLDFAIKVATVFNVSLDWLSGQGEEMRPVEVRNVDTPKDILLRELINLGIIKPDQKVSDEEMQRLLAVAKSLLN